MKNVENGNLSNEGFTIIPSCNNRFANVKFRLKTNQIEIIFKSCPEGKSFMGNRSKDNCSGEVS